MPRGARKIAFSFEEKSITHYAGMWLIQGFCSQIGLKQLLQRYVPLHQRNNQYHASEMVLSLLYSVIMGLKRINKTEILQYNGSFLEMLGLDNFPDQSTLRRFLQKLSCDDIRRLVRLHDSLRAFLFDMPRPRHSLTFDVDSVVIVVYGKAQRAAIGYNPKKPGRRSYHPIFCFEAHLQEFWHGSLRAGNAASSTGIVPFLKACLAKAPQKLGRERIRFRMDAGFFSRRVVEFLDASGCGYVIVAKEYPPVKQAAMRARFTSLSNGWQHGQFKYQPQGWSKPHRFIVVRRPIPEDPHEAQQLTLFKDRKYAYHVFVTNLTSSPWRVYLFYNGRAATEKNNRELLYDYPLGKIPSRDWIANVAFFQLLLFAFNIVHWFKRICLPSEYRVATLDTIRSDFLVLPGKLVRASKKNLIKLPRDYHYKKEFLASFTAISKMRFHKKFRFCSQNKLAHRAEPTQK